MLGFGVRFLFLEKHFSHVDDIGVAVTIIDRQAYMDSIEDRFDQWKVEILNGEMGSSAESIARTLDEMSILQEVVYFGLWWRNILHPIPNGWTYAPGQFYLTNFLVTGDLNYSEAKFWGRLPSLIFNLAALALLITFYLQFNNRKSGMQPIVIGVTIFSLSWQNIIYSAQMENYASSNFAMFFVFLHLIYILRSPIVSNKKAFFRGVLLAIPGIFQYQAIFFIPPLFITLLFYLNSKEKIKEITRNTIFTFLGFFTVFIIFIFPYLKDSAGRGITWNAGPKNEFVFNLNISDGFYSFFTDASFFFIHNFYLLIEAMLTPISYFSNNSNFLGLFLSLFSLLGIYTMLSSSNKFKKTFVIFVLFSFILWITLICLQIFPLSPTRHSMVLGAIFLILIIEGFDSMEKLINFSFLRKSIGGISILTLFFSLIWLILFVSTLGQGIKVRTDLFNESSIYKSLTNDQVDLTVVFDSTLQLRLMPKITENFPSLDANAWTKNGIVEISDYGADDKDLNDQKSLRVAIISSWSCINLSDDRSIELIEGVIIDRYGLNAEYNDVQMLRQECTESKVEVEWSPLTQNGQNNFNYTLIEIIS
ncbi:hypothetical protein N9M18_02285 [Candidatus Pseudothioglobus singularis]|nr:hypothetical protein [Candidatus Pseudothioglobus singularis]